MNKKPLLVLAGILILLGYFKPDLSSINNLITPSVINNQVVVTEPSDPELRSKCSDVIKALRSSGSRHKDGRRLGDLCVDLSTLIKLEGDSSVIKTTDEIREANSLAGPMLRMNIKGDYPDLAGATNSVIVVAIGSDNIVLSPELRTKAAEAFEALAWAFYEGSK
jgi:hypothetical protein